MKVVFTLVRKVIEDGKIIRIETVERVAEDVKNFQFNETSEVLNISFNVGNDEIISLLQGDNNHLEQWTFLDAKFIQVPLKI